jgi:CPA2 family monovalent cation:H+ antiporter-2
MAIVLSVAGLATVVFQRLKLPIIAGYLIAGVVVGPQVGPQLVTDPGTIRTLAELGVVLLMTSVGLEFRVRRVLRLGPRVGLTVVLEVGTMLSLGYALGKLLGWSETDALLAAGVVAISSTAVIAKQFEHRPPDWRVKDLVFGVLVLEDLIAIVLVALATAVTIGGDASLATIGRLLGRLGMVLAGLIVLGVMIVPPVIRTVVRLERSETTLVTAVGISFLLAYLTDAAGSSVALGGFAAGVLMAEAGVGHQVGEVIRPVRDLFGAVFFVAVGMLLDVRAALAAAELVALFSLVVVVGKAAGVSIGAFLSGFGTRVSVQAGLAMSQIGEFSFIIAGLGLARSEAGAPLYSVAVSTAMVTALATSWLSAESARFAKWVDRRLPAPLQTFATLYGAWLEDLGARRGQDGPWRRARRLLWLLALDTAIVGGALIVTSIGYRAGPERLREFGLGPEVSRVTILILGAAVALPFGFGLVLAGRRLARQLAESAVPPVAVGKVDQGRAPRRALVVSLEIAIAFAVGLPLVVATLPFLPPFGAPGVIAAVLILLGLAFWRTARDLDSHTRAGAELVAHVLARQAGGGHGPELSVVRGMLPGLGELSPVQVERGGRAVGRTLGDLDLRGVTGATVVALTRGGEQRPYPDAEVRLEEGDLIALTGTHEAISQAEALMRATGTRTPPTDTAATGGPAAPASGDSAVGASDRPAGIPS